MRNVPFTKIAHHSQVDERVRQALLEGRFAAGTGVRAFEKIWAKTCGALYCAAVASGSAALEVALRGLVKPGGVVLMPALSFAATVTAVLNAGLQPLFVDVTSCGLIDLESIRYRSEYDAVLPVHLYGQLVDIVKLQTIVNPMIPIIEDASQAHGELRTVHGDAACFSFYCSKNLGAAGEAGAIVSDREDIIEWSARFVDYGRTPGGDKHVHAIPSSNLRMDEIQAEVLLAKVESLMEFNAQRAWMAQMYLERGIPSIAQAPTSWHLYPIFVEHPKKLISDLEARGVHAQQHYPYLLPDILSLEHGDRRWPMARRIAAHVVTLPMGPGYDEDEIDYVVEAINDSTQLQR